MANILIDTSGTLAQPKGLLADWDLCKYEEELTPQPTQPGGRSVSSNPRSLRLVSNPVLMIDRELGHSSLHWR